MGHAYSHREAARILKIKPGRLRYWERTELVRPSVVHGSRRAFGFADLVRLRGVLGLLGRGVPLRRIRRSALDLRRRIPEIIDPLAALRLWDERSQRVVAAHAGGLFEPGGQMMLDFRNAAPAIAELGPAGPTTAADWFERGCALDSDPPTFGDAIEAYRKALALEPDYADAHCNLGTIYFHQGRRERALECFRRALASEPLHLEANFNAANLLEEQRADEAVRHYRTVLRIDPQYADAHVNLALLYERLGRVGLGRDHWRRYLQIEPAGAWAEIARRRLGASRGPLR